MFGLKKEKIKDIHEFHPLNVEIEDRPINPLGRAILLTSSLLKGKDKKDR